jgi:heat shock protein HtpX
MDVWRLRLRLSLFCRALVALGILAVVSIGLIVVLSLLGSVLALSLVGWAIDEPFLTILPRLSSHLSVSPTLAAVGSVVGLVFLFWILDFFPPVEEQSTLHRPLALGLLMGALGCLYVMVAESAAVLAEPPVWEWLRLFVLLGGVIAVPMAVSKARDELGELRKQLLADSHPAEETHPELVDTVNRLALQADVPPPTLRVTETDRPESFALGSGADAVIVVSTGLCTVLNDDEVTAVLAHEVSHLANADSRIMEAVLVPVLIADEPFSTDSGSDEERGNTGYKRLKRYGQFGVALLSRGREWHADAGAVALTGSPASLSSALERLDSERQKPTTDLRDWEVSITALDILPPSDREHATGPFRTHPSTKKRIERLRQQVVTAERSSV